MACLSCTIEMEPRTLNEGQLSNAREAAVDIVQKVGPDKASNIFTEELTPDAIKGMEEVVEKRDQLHKLVDCKEGAQVIERPCECLCTSISTDESPDKAKLREPLSAPF